MANFLTRMAGRALGVTPVAQPFVPAMFNPGFGRANKEAAADAVPEFRVASMARPAAADSQPAPSRSHTQPAFTPATLPQPASSSLPPSSLPYPRVQPAGREDRRPLSPAAAPLTCPATASDPSPDPLTDVTRPYSPLSTFAAPPAPDYELPPDTIRSARTEPAVVRPPAHGFKAVSPHTSASLANPGPSVRPFRPESALETQAPVIRVSIGRIDVRAQFSASPAPPPKSARPPALSLDEYLKQRSEGRR